MKILLNCLPAGDAAGFDSLFTPLLDRPFLQGVVEHLVQSGATSIDAMAASGDPRVAALLGDGTRWGCPVRVHHTDAALPVAIREVAGRADIGEALLLASGHSLPITDLGANAPSTRQLSPVVFLDETRGEWTGWAWLPRHSLSVVARLGSDNGLAKRLLSWSAASGHAVRARHVLSVASAKDLLAAHEAVLSDVCPTWQRAAREHSPGVWLARNAVVRPGTTIVGPVFIGEGAHVDARTFGPFAVAAGASVVDGAHLVSRAVVMGHTYLGPNLSLTEAVASGRTLSSVRHGAVADIADATFLHALGPDAGSRGWLDRWLTRLRAQPAGGASQTAPVPAD